MDIPFNILVLFLAIAFTIGIIGIILGLRKVNGAPFIVIIAGMMIFAFITIVDKVEVDYVENVEYSVSHPMNVTTSASSSAFSATLTALSERPANVQSALVNKVITCIEVNMFRTGSPTQNVMIGIGDNDARMVKLFGNITATSINTVTRSYQVCLPNHDYWIIAYNDYIMVKHAGSSAGNNIAVSFNTANPFDGTNSVRAHYTSGTWTDVTADDLRMKLTTENSDIVGVPVFHDFNETDAWAFMIFLSAFFAFMGILIMRQLK